MNDQQIVGIRSTGNIHYSMGIQGSVFEVIDDTPLSSEISGFTRGIWSTGSLNSISTLVIDGMRIAC
ncbi:MAG: hypothetical protein SGI87_06505 [Flavobacteriales bacterium]|nr:hypothetical protein [Flavobacteriales bacterium]